MVETYGKWPGVAAIAGDADLWCVPCAKQRYGEKPVQAVISSVPGYERYTDFERNPLTVVLHGSSDLHTQYCGRCLVPLCDDDCLCYQPEQAEYYRQHGTFRDEIPGSGKEGDAMNLWDYTEEVLRTYAGSHDGYQKLCLGALGVAGESGEVADLIKKWLFQGHELDNDKLLDEVGDVLWYLALICDVLDVSLAEPIARNVAKLRKRYPDGFDAQRSVNRE